MDVGEKYPGITHVSFKVGSLEAAGRFLAELGIPLSGRFSFKDLRAVFIRDLGQRSTQAKYSRN